MKTYRIEHIETLGGHFYVKANSHSEALEKFDIEVADGKIDLSKLEMIDSSNVAEEVLNYEE